jgi:type II secretory pathway pseudopilin PulG
MVIIVILISAVMVAAPALIGKAKTTNTLAMLTVVQSAVDEFKREQNSKPTVAKNRSYRKRYGEYPPDELEVFTAVGVPGGASRSLVPGGGTMIPDGTGGGGGYRPMKFYARGLPPDASVTEFRDQVAMTVAIQLLGDTSASILAGVQDQYWSAPLDPSSGNPAVFVDRDKSGAWDPNDHQVRYIIDDWDNPISYMAQRDFDEAARTHLASSNHPAWNEGATEMIRLNGGKPIIFSYGPDGPEQLAEEQMGDDATASLLIDFEDDHIVNHPLNADNVYSNPAVKESLAKGIEER